MPELEHACETLSRDESCEMRDGCFVCAPRLFHWASFAFPPSSMVYVCRRRRGIEKEGDRQEEIEKEGEEEIETGGD